MYISVFTDHPYLSRSWYNPSRMRVLAGTSIPEQRELDHVSGGEGLPCTAYPSDHLMLCVDLGVMRYEGGKVAAKAGR